MNVGSELKNELTGALVGLARVIDNGTAPAETTWRVVLEGLFLTIPELNVSEAMLRQHLARVAQEKLTLVPDCASCQSPCGRTDSYNMALLLEAEEAVRSIKLSILAGIRTMSAYFYHAVGCETEKLKKLLYQALFAIGEDWDVSLYMPIAERVIHYNLSCMLDAVDIKDLETLEERQQANAQ